MSNKIDNSKDENLELNVSVCNSDLDFGISYEKVLEQGEFSINITANEEEIKAEVNFKKQF